MTDRKTPFASILLGFVSHEVVDRICAPKLYAVQLRPYYGQSCDTDSLPVSPSSKAPLSFLAWVQMWLRLVLRLEMIPKSHRDKIGTYAAIAVSYRQIQPEVLDKPAAHNLEALMRFAPDSTGQSLTLNQYRERFTRLCVLGRVKLYERLIAGFVFWRRPILRGLSVLNVFRFIMTATCHAPLRPD